MHKTYLLCIINFRMSQAHSQDYFFYTFYLFIYLFIYLFLRGQDQGGGQGYSHVKAYGDVPPK